MECLYNLIHIHSFWEAISFIFEVRFVISTYAYQMGVWGWYMDTTTNPCESTYFISILYSTLQFRVLTLGQSIKHVWLERKWWNKSWKLMIIKSILSATGENDMLISLLSCPLMTHVLLVFLALFVSFYLQSFTYTPICFQILLLINMSLLLEGS